MTQESLVTMIVVAAGTGSRLGGPRPKQYRLLEERPVLFHTLMAFQEHPLITAIQPVIARDGRPFWDQLIAPHQRALSRVLDPVTGGMTRQESVFNGLCALSLPGDHWVGIHDAARPFVSHALLDRLFAARLHGDALIAALPAADTVKRVDPHRLLVEETLDRNAIWLAQTPQLFRFGLIHALHLRAQKEGFVATDDASLAEWGGHEVRVVPGDGRNMKITEPGDLVLAQRWIQESGQ